MELDARRTADGAVVVHHDAVVPGVGAIVEQTAASLRRRAPWVPTLAEALEACAGMWVDVEVKNSPADPDWDPEDGLVDRVLETHRAPGRPGGAAHLVQPGHHRPGPLPGRRACPPGGWWRSRRCSPPWPGRPRRAIASCCRTTRCWAGLPRRAVVESARQAGIGLIAWTVDDPAEGRRLAAAGLDGIITNRPDALRSALDEHRHHHGG